MIFARHLKHGWNNRKARPDFSKGPELKFWQVCVQRSLAVLTIIQCWVISWFSQHDLWYVQKFSTETFGTFVMNFMDSFAIYRRGLAIFFKRKLKSSLAKSSRIMTHFWRLKRITIFGFLIWLLVQCGNSLFKQTNHMAKHEKNHHRSRSWLLRYLMHAVLPKLICNRESEIFKSLCVAKITEIANVFNCQCVVIRRRRYERQRVGLHSVACVSCWVLEKHNNSISFALSSLPRLKR